MTKIKYWLLILAISVVLIAGSLAVSPIAIADDDDDDDDDDGDTGAKTNPVSEAIDRLTAVMQSTTTQGPQGPPGADGLPGADGQDGADGSTGPPGPPGADAAGPIAGSWAPDSNTSPTARGFVIWDIEKINTDTDTFGFVSARNFIQIKQAGTYLVTATVLTFELSAGERSDWALRTFNSADILQENICVVTFFAGGRLDSSSCTAIVSFNANDRIKLEDFNNDNGIFGSAQNPGNTFLTVSQ